MGVFELNTFETDVCEKIEKIYDGEMGGESKSLEVLFEGVFCWFDGVV